MQIVLAHNPCAMHAVPMRVLTNDARIWLKSAMRSPGMNADAIAKKLKLTRRNLYHLLAGGNVSKKTETLLEKSLRAAGITRISVDPVSEMRDRTVMYSNRLLRDIYIPDIRLSKPHELRNLILDKTIRHRLLTPTKSPSLFEVARSTSVFLSEEHEKADERIGDNSYNHFFQVSALIEYTWPNCPAPAYLTHARQGPLYPHTKYRGTSLHWGASYLYHREHSLPETPMEEWILACRERPARADELFCKGSLSILRRLLFYRIQLPEHYETRIRPFAVVNLDLRNPKKNRIHTYFIFKMTIQLSDPINLENEPYLVSTNCAGTRAVTLSSLSRRDFVSTIPHDTGEERIDRMNYALYEVLCGHWPKSDRGVTFKEGFDLVPEQ